MAKKTRLPDTPQQAMLRQVTAELAKCSGSQSKTVGLAISANFGTH